LNRRVRVSGAVVQLSGVTGHGGNSIPAPERCSRLAPAVAE
jgi:hypothetical protein